MRIRLDILRSERGLTLVEIMVASAILMVIALTVSTLMYNASTRQSLIEERARSVEELQNTATTMRLKPVAP